MIFCLGVSDIDADVGVDMHMHSVGPWPGASLYETLGQDQGPLHDLEEPYDLEKLYDRGPCIRGPLQPVVPPALRRGDQLLPKGQSFLCHKFPLKI